MASSPAAKGLTRFGETQRRDAWWVEIIPIILLMGGFSVYATFRAFEGSFYHWGPYLSPFYSPLIDPYHRWLPEFITPAMLILAGPLGFRATCYYYRKALYRAFLFDPPACAVGEGSSRNYRGETAFPFILQNVHRYFLYLAILFLIFLWHDVYQAFLFPGRLGREEFGLGIGTLVMLANVVLLSMYTLSCHSLRHLAGGKLDCFSCAAFGAPRHTAWSWLTFLNERHMRFAWASLISVGFTDFYIRCVAIGVFKDFRLL